jgi:hypothetical protein
MLVRTSKLDPELIDTLSQPTRQWRFFLTDQFVYGKKIVPLSSPRRSTMSGDSISFLQIGPKLRRSSSITVSSCGPQLYETPAIVCGLNYVSRIFVHLGETLVRIRADKRSQPQGYFATSRLKEMQTLYSRVLATCTDAPEALQLNLARAGHRSHDNYGGADFRQTALAVVRDMFENPNAARDPAVLDPFLVMRAHIYVTQASSLQTCRQF